MANPARGEAALVIAGAPYTLRFVMASFPEMEDALGEPLDAVYERLTTGRVGLDDARVVLWGGLRATCPGLALEDAGPLVDRAFRADGFSALVTGLVAGLAAAQPDPTPDDDEDGEDLDSDEDDEPDDDDTPAAGATWEALHAAAVTAGMDPERFWQLTPREVAREMRALQRRDETLARRIAWHTVRFTRMKRVPALVDVLPSTRPAADRHHCTQTAAQQAAMLDKAAAAA